MSQANYFLRPKRLTMKRKAFVTIGVILLLLFTVLAISKLRNNTHQIQLRNVQLEERGAALKSLELKYQNLNLELDHTDKTNKAEIERLQKEKTDLDTEKKRLEAELQAKIQRKEAERVVIANRARELANTVTFTQTASAAAQTAPVSGNAAKAFIYAHESGNRTNAINASSGACGLGQALPCSKMGCGLSDYACQDAWFTNYAMQRYGSWENAMAFWQAHKWW